MRVRRVGLVSLMFCTVVALAPAALADDDVSIVSDDDTVTFQKQDAGDLSATVAILNNEDSAVDVAANLPAGPPSDACRPRADPAQVAPHHQQTVTLTAPNGCGLGVGEAPADLTLIVGNQSFELTATVTDQPKADFADLNAFWQLGLAALVLTMAGWLWGASIASVVLNPLHPIPSLDARWSFSDSWASTATTVTALLAGVFGSTDLASFVLGDEAAGIKDVIALGSALALGLVGAAPFVLQLCRTPQGIVTPLGLVLAGTLTMAGTGGELSIILSSVGPTATFDGNHWVGIVRVITYALLAAYAVVSTMQMLVQGSAAAPAGAFPAAQAQRSAALL